GGVLPLQLHEDVRAIRRNDLAKANDRRVSDGVENVHGSLAPPAGRGSALAFTWPGSHGTGRGEEVRHEHHVLDRLPVDAWSVQAKPDPSPRSDVGREEVSLRVFLQEAALLAGRCLAQKRDASIAMMVVGVVPEDLLPHLERQVLGPRPLDLGLRQRLAQCDQSLSPAGHVRGSVHHEPGTPSNTSTRPLSREYSAPTTSRPSRSISRSRISEPWRSWFAETRTLARTASRMRASRSSPRSVASRPSTEGRMRSTIERRLRD